MKNFIKILMALALILASGETMAKKPPKLPSVCLNPPNPGCKSECDAFKKGMSNPGMVASACNPPKQPTTKRSTRKVSKPATVVELKIPWWEIAGLVIGLMLLRELLFFFFSRHRRRKEDLIAELRRRVEAVEGTSAKTSGQVWELIVMLERRQLVDSNTTPEELLAMLKERCVIPGQTDEGKEFQQNLLQ